MQETFGKVTVTYEEEAARTEQIRPEDEKILGLLEDGYDCRTGEAPSWPVLYHLSHLRANLTQWLPIEETDTVLEFGADSGQLTGGFLGKAKSVFCLEASVSRSRILARRYETAENLSVYAGDLWRNLERLNRKFDWIIAPGVLSEAVKYFTGESPEAAAIKQLKAYLKEDGHLVLAEDNRYGLKYWAGAMEPHTGRYFDSLKGEGRTFSKRELERIFEKSGFAETIFYYPYPERWFPVSIYSDERLPGKGELNRNLRNFEGERLVLFEEEKVYDGLIRDGRFPEFSNAYLCVLGPGFAEKQIYIKYSNDRAEEFAIRTDIVKRPGQKETEYEVRKIPVSVQAKEHVRGMKRREERLDTQYAGTKVRANRCVLRENMACFEFLKGRTFEERLDSLRAKKDYGALAAELQNYKRLLTETLEKEMRPFEKSGEFMEMFGNPAFSKAYEGAKVNNLDWIFSNLMETEDGIWIIDYEWTFPVQVPAEYLIWRAVSLYLHGREDIRDMGFMAQLGIGPEEEAAFEDMEHHFQRWLLKGTVTIGEQYLSTAGRTIYLDSMVDKAKKNRIQIYTDTGGGFSEEESYWMDTEPDKQGVIHLELLLPEGVRAVRLDPAERSCIVKVKRLLGELGGTYPLTYIHNGRELEEQGILYTTQDPQITVPQIVEGTGRIYAELMAEEIYPDTAYTCMNLLNRVRAAERIYASAPYRFLRRLKRIIKK